MNQLAIDFTPRDVGAMAANQCLDKAERVAAFDTEGARFFILGYLQKHGQQSGEVLTDACKDAGFKPHDDRAFGSLFSSLARQNLIRTVGFCERRKGNGTAGGRVWGLCR
jgi:hypothetical protein